MSYKITDRVFEHSQQTGNALLLLLAISTHCDHYGTNAFPSVDTLAKKIRMTRRTVFRLLKQLEASKEITIVHRAGNTSYLTVNLGIEQGALFDSEGGDRAASQGGDRAVTPPGVTELCHAKGPIKDPIKPLYGAGAEVKETLLPQDWWPDEKNLYAKVDEYPELDIGYETRQFIDTAILKRWTSLDWTRRWKQYIDKSVHNYAAWGKSGRSVATKGPSLQQKVEAFVAGNGELTNEEYKQAYESGILVY